MLVLKHSHYRDNNNWYIFVVYVRLGRYANYLNKLHLIEK